jgi:iron(III) transport system substrate-binding protein
MTTDVCPSRRATPLRVLDPRSTRDGAQGRWPAAIAVVIALALLLAIAQPGCNRSDTGHASSQQQLVLYTSVDEPYVKPILADFESRTGIKVLLQTDTEATKSAGLAARLEAERDNPRADVWWGNEVFHTIRLAEAGVLAPYDSPAARDIGERFKDVAGHRWAGAGLRARMVAIHGDPPKDGSYVNGLSLDDLLKPEHRGKVDIARPTAGTTGGHVAALYVMWGRERFADYFTKLKANGVKLVGGNGPVAEAVGRGDAEIGLTDNDDVASVQRDDGGGGQIAAGLPDQDTAGTLAIPTTVALVAGSRNGDAAKKLIDYLLSPEVERKLIEAKFAGWSVRDPATSIRTMNVDFTAAANALPAAVELSLTILEGRK